LLSGRASSGPDLGALLAVVLVAWVASAHERRCAELGAKVAALKARCAADREAVVALRATAVTLRARADRLETSLTFLRDVAARMEGDDPVAAAQAALDLAVARIGARAGVVAAIEAPADGPPGLVTLASFGTVAAIDPRADITAASALLNRRATRAIDVGDQEPGGDPARQGDLRARGLGNDASDLVAPILLRAAAGDGGEAGEPGESGQSGQPVL